MANSQQNKAIHASDNGPARPRAQGSKIGKGTSNPYGADHPYATGKKATPEGAPMSPTYKRAQTRRLGTSDGSMVVSSLKPVTKVTKKTGGEKYDKFKDR